MSQTYPHPLAKLRDALAYILSCSCLPNPRGPPSPALSAQEGELDGLLFEARPDLGGGDESGWRDDDLDDALSLRGVSGRGFRRTQPKRSKREMLGGLFGRRSKPVTAEALATAPPAPQSSALDGAGGELHTRGKRSGTTSSSRSTGSTGSGVFGIGGGSDLDEDAESLGENTLAALPDLAKKWDPETSLEELAREEEDQAKRDREMGRDRDRDRARARMAEVDEEFGDFEDGEVTPKGRPAALP